MILPEHLKWHSEMKKYCQDPMLVLGNQENKTGFQFTKEHYFTLDPDGGDIRENCDLNEPLANHLLENRWRTVYNLGTIEHIWNVHRAFVNASKMVMVGGHYLHHGPCGGYENHGIHVTDWALTLKFFMLNGFEVLEYWFTSQAGEVCDPPKRGGGNVIFWFAAKKVEAVETFTCPQQVFEGGVKV